MSSVTGSTIEITGTIAVEENFTTRDAANQLCTLRRPLAGVTIEVQGSPQQHTGFAAYGEAPTDHRGQFHMSVNGAERIQHARAVVRFAGELLTVGYSPGKGIQHTQSCVVAELATSGLPLLDLGTLAFRADAPGVLGAPEVVRHAQTWYVVRAAMDHLDGLGAGLGFINPIAVVYPATVVSGSSCANGLTRVAYIHRDNVRDDWSADIVLHQIMHLWMHQHSHGTAEWVRAGCAQSDPDTLERQPAIAFHEGFAEFAKNELKAALWGRTHPGESNAVRTSGERCLPSLHMEFRDALRVFLPAPSAGHPTAWPVGSPDLGLEEFYRRAFDILSSRA